MQDFYIEQDNNTYFDLVVDEDSKEFESVDGMETAFLVQLFADQRVTKEERANARDRQGWVGDLLTRDISYQIGSLLHLQIQSRDTTADNNETAAYAKSALEYFKAIGAAKKVSASLVGTDIEGEITTYANEVNRYSGLWKATNGVNT